MWTRLVRISDPGQWFGKIHEPVTRVQHLVRTNSYVNATVSLVRRYGAVDCMKKRELIQDPDCTLALQHVLDLVTWASYPGQIFPVWTQVNISDDNLMMWNTWTTDPGTICEHGLSLCSHLEITRVISRTKSGFVYVNATSPDQWPGSVVRENTRTSDPGTTFGPDQLICERYSFLGPPLWRCGLYEEERTHSGSWLHFSPPACSGSTNMG